jgi:hypothetical protein
VEIDQFGWHHPRSEKLWSRSAVYCALNRLQSVDLTFCLTIAPGQVDGVADSVDITAKYTGKTGQEGESGMDRIIDPSFELRRISATKYSAKSHGEAAHNVKATVPCERILADR